MCFPSEGRQAVQRHAVLGWAKPKDAAGTEEEEQRIQEVQVLPGFAMYR